MTASDDRAPSLISVDWGTTALRLYLLGSNARVLDRIATQDGMARLSPTEFSSVLQSHCSIWLTAHGPLPALLSGMVGSRQGWVEAPYVSGAAGLAELATELVALEVPGFRSVHIIPGIMCVDAMGIPDVMRGEECQIMGALSLMGLSDGMFVLPGTHSKWVRVVAGRIIDFQTFMTGEVFAALRDHTVLGRMMAKPAVPQVEGRSEAFARGVTIANQSRAPGAWLHRLFSVRTLGLMGKLSEEDASDYLSGLMIGWEFASYSPLVDERLTIIGNKELSKRYGDAADLLGLTIEVAPDDCVCAGHQQIAAAAVGRRGTTG